MNVIKRYYPIHLELLGLTWALQPCDFYLRGNPGFVVKTDHHPLVGLCKKNIRDTREKLQPLLDACSLYNFKVEYIPGKKNLVADLLSRNPLWGEERPTVVDKCGRVIAFNTHHKMLREEHPQPSTCPSNGCSKDQESSNQEILLGGDGR